MTMTDKERRQDAADIAVQKMIEKLVKHHKPEDYMCSLGIRFASGLQYLSPEEIDDALEAFSWRVHKYTGIIIGQKEPVDD